eukprot:15044300-Alexandrium_andersonii.AAC.1
MTNDRLLLAGACLSCSCMCLALGAVLAACACAPLGVIDIRQRCLVFCASGAVGLGRYCVALLH